MLGSAPAQENDLLLADYHITDMLSLRTKGANLERGTKWGPNALKTLGRAGKMAVGPARRRSPEVALRVLQTANSASASTR